MFLYQEIFNQYMLGPAYHLTHIHNLSLILDMGELNSHSRMRGRGYFDLSNEDVQAGRAAITVPVTNRPLHDYVPLYFGFKTPMVACNQILNEDLIFLRFSLNILAGSGVLITDGNARSKGTIFCVYKALEDLSIIDVSAVRSVKYAHDLELKRKKQAEILIPDRLSYSNVIDIICFSDVKKLEVLNILQKSGNKTSVIVNQGWYFMPRTHRG